MILIQADGKLVIKYDIPVVLVLEYVIIHDNFEKDWDFIDYGIFTCDESTFFIL